MTSITRSAADIGGRKISLLRGGSGREPVLFLHGGLPGITPYCSGAHVWSRYLPLAAAERAVVAPDLPGFGDSAAGGEPSHVVRMTISVTDLDAYRDNLRPIGRAWKERFGKHFPAMALVGVSGLVERRAKVEIEATACLPEPGA